METVRLVEPVRLAQPEILVEAVRLVEPLIVVLASLITILTDFET